MTLQNKILKNEKTKRQKDKKTKRQKITKVTNGFWNLSLINEVYVKILIS
jgi:hypothetical protein